MTAARRALLAELLEPVEAETPYGGRSVSYELIGTVWLNPGGVRRRQRAEAGASVTDETATAEARADVRLTVGRLLRFGGADWRIVAGDTVGGRAVLNLERVR